MVVLKKTKEKMEDGYVKILEYIYYIMLYIYIYIYIYWTAGEENN